MVLLAENQSLLSWEEIQKHVDYEHGITQFINLMKIAKTRVNYPFKWGDETEYTLVKFDNDLKRVYANCRTNELLHLLEKETLDDSLGGSHWVPEFTLFQIESTPGVPFEGISRIYQQMLLGFLDCFKMVEENMRARREQLEKHLEDDESCLTVSFPSIGVNGFSKPPINLNPLTGGTSIYIPDELTHQGYINLVKIIKDRRKEKIAINVPVFKDKNTPTPYVEDFSIYGSPEATSAAKTDHIYMDHMIQGLGYVCLQVTMQARDFEEARNLYDQLMPLTPIVLSLSASSPIFKSTLSDVDTRWNALCESIDDRTPEEKGLEPLKTSPFTIDSYRYGTAENYISASSEIYNDINIKYNSRIVTRLTDAGMDETFSKFIANIFIRDPLQLAEGQIELDDEKNFHHCETLLCSVWHNLRFKQPPLNNAEIGWRVEFRPTENQPSNFENAAFVCFIVLYARMVILEHMNTLVPISKVVENMQRAQKRDAVLKEKFYFRKELLKNKSDYVEMSLDEVINGKKGEFVGLVPLIIQFLDIQEICQETRTIIDKYLDFISKRASGKIPTVAKWIRNFVTSHPDYKQDSQVSNTTIYDLIKELEGIGKSKQPLF